jgi:hypothetical protein
LAINGFSHSSIRVRYRPDREPHVDSDQGEGPPHTALTAKNGVPY